MLLIPNPPPNSYHYGSLVTPGPNNLHTLPTCPMYMFVLSNPQVPSHPSNHISLSIPCLVPYSFWIPFITECVHSKHVLYFKSSYKCVYPINENNGLGVFNHIDQSLSTRHPKTFTFCWSSACSCISNMSINQLPRLMYCHIHYWNCELMWFCVCHVSFITLHEATWGRELVLKSND